MSDINTQKFLSDEERREFREWEKGFQSDFWKLLQRDMEAELESLPTQLFYAVKSWDELVAARSRLQTVGQLLAYPTIIEQKKENLITARQMEADEEREDASVEYL